MALTIKDIPLFKGFSESELSTIQSCFRERAFEKGETLFLEGASCDRVFFVKSGRVKIFRIGPSGREQILETLGPGDTCACNPGAASWNCSSSAEAAAASVVWFLSRENYVKLVQNNAKLARSLNMLFAERLQCFSSLIEEVSLKDSKKRLVKFILDLAAQAKPGSAAVELPFTREELAQRIGVARETVARQLHELKSKHLIDIKTRQIQLKDIEGLKKLL